MKLFVTGATGFIGSHFLNAALSAGHDVVALRRSEKSKPRVPIIESADFNLNLPLKQGPFLGILTWLDKQMPDVTVEDLAGCDVLVHLAAVGITPQPATWEGCFQFNVIETMALVRKALEAGVKRVVVTGTYAEYGLAGLRFDPIPPDAPLEPTDPYAASKAAASIALASLCRVEKFELVYFRVFSVFGEGQYEKNFWPQLRKAAQAGDDFPMTSGEQIRDFLPVEDAAAQLAKALTRTDVEPGIPWIRNLASGTPVTLKHFAETCWRELGAQGTLQIGAIANRPNEVMRYVPLVRLK